jgi:hypothetical protein
LGGFLIKINRDCQLICHALPQPARHLHAFHHGHAGNRYKGDHVRRANPRVLTLMLLQVNQLGGFGNRGKGGGFNRRGFSHKSQNGAVMVQVGMAVQNPHAGHSLNSRDNLVHHLRAAGFRKVWDAFHNFHWHIFLQGEFCLDYTKPGAFTLSRFYFLRRASFFIISQIIDTLLDNV